jgi:hypothetical protein
MVLVVMVQGWDRLTCPTQYKVCIRERTVLIILLYPVTRLLHGSAVLFSKPWMTVMS